jgi:hypothetical protein
MVMVATISVCAALGIPASGVTTLFAHQRDNLS